MSKHVKHRSDRILQKEQMETHKNWFMNVKSKNTEINNQINLNFSSKLNQIMLLMFKSYFTLIKWNFHHCELTKSRQWLCVFHYSTFYRSPIKWTLDKRQNLISEGLWWIPPDEGLSCSLLELWIWWSCLRKLFENSHWTLRWQAI